MTDNEIVYDARHARTGEMLWWFTVVLAVFFTVLGIVNKSLFTVVTVAAGAGAVWAALRWRSMRVAISGDDVELRQFLRTERVPIATITEVGVTLPQFGTHPEAVFVRTGDRRVVTTVTAFTRADVDAGALVEALESHGWHPAQPAGEVEPEPTA